MKAPQQAVSQREFIALMAMVAATVAFSIDSMLPALPEIGAELTPGDLNKAQLILTSFVLGMGLGTFFTGPLSDAFGRRPVMVGGAIVYIIGSAIAWAAASLEIMLFARVLQGIGAAGPRVVSMAMIRDLYAGPNMAKILSFVMIIFSLVPALAPTMGHYIIEAFGWRAIFLTFILFACISTWWLLLRQPETLAPENRRPLSSIAMIKAVYEMFAHPTARLSILIQTLTFGMLFTVLSSTQQVFDQTYNQGAHFHLWFGGIAIVAASASFLNANIVERYGMRAIVKSMYAVQIGITLLLIVVVLFDAPFHFAFGMYVLWNTGMFFQAGLCIGNLNALGMEEMGHMAGMAATVLASFATVGAVFIAVPIGLMFDGTPLPMAFGTLACCVLALWLTTKIKRPGET